MMMMMMMMMTTYGGGGDDDDDDDDNNNNVGRVCTIKLGFLHYLLSSHFTLINVTPTY